MILSQFQISILKLGETLHTSFCLNIDTLKTYPNLARPQRSHHQKSKWYDQTFYVNTKPLTNDQKTLDGVFRRSEIKCKVPFPE